MKRQADFYRKRAIEMRELGRRAPTTTIKASFEGIALEYDTLALQAEKDAHRSKLRLS